jgi:predicted GTPase
VNKAELIKALESYPDDVEILVPEGMEGVAVKVELAEVLAAPAPSITRNGFVFWEPGDADVPEFYPDNDPAGTRPTPALMLRRSWA